MFRTTKLFCKVRWLLSLALLILFAGWSQAQAPRPVEVAEPVNRALLPPIPLPEPLSGAPATTVRGTVKDFTTAAKGETNGFVLEDGTRVSIPPQMSEKVTGMVHKKDRVQIEGRPRKTPGGETLLDATTITNLGTNASVHMSNAVPVAAETTPKPTPTPNQTAEPKPMPTPNRTADLDQRLKSLEQKVDQILTELKQMQRNKEGK